MKNKNLNKSIIIIILFVVGIYFFTWNHKVPAPVSDTKEPQNQQEYESMVVSNCVAAQKDYEKQYEDAINQCNGNTTCAQQANNQFGATRGDEFIKPCVQTTVWNDEMSTEIIKGYAEQTQLSVYMQEAKSLSDKELIKEIQDGTKTLYARNYDTNMGFQLSAYIREYDQRNPEDPLINNIINIMIDKFGPCWGIPSGQCLE